MHSPLLTNAINDSLHHAMTGAVGLDVMLALLILSLQPATTGAATAVRLISLAYEMGAALGMEANVEAALRHPDQLCEPWWKSRLEEILLVCYFSRCVINDMADQVPVGGSQSPVQHVSCNTVKQGLTCSVHLGVSRFSTFKPSSAARFPNHPADNVRDAIRYLQAANSVVEVFRPYVEKLSRFEADGIYTTPNIQSLTTAWAAMDQRVEAARKQRMRFNMLERDVLLCHFAMSHRTVCCIAGLPRPFGPVEDKLNANQTAGHRMMLNGSILVDIWNKMDDGHLLTGHVILIIVIAIGCIRAVWATVNKQHPNLMGLDMDKVEKAAQKIHTMGGMGSSVLTRLSDAFARSFEHDSEACNNSVDQFLLDWGNPANWLDGDFASWSWLLTGQTNGDELPNGGGSSTI